jgi:predicted HicB family RNase H-like nuclease
MLIRMRQLEYKGYIGEFTYDEEQELFEGSVSNIQDRIIFYAKSVESLHSAFQDSVNDYLLWCKRIGKEPEKPSSLPNLLIKS